MRLLVVGAGASGLPAIKTGLEYGFEVVCMEKSQDIGGLWRYKPNPKPDEGTVMKSTVINTSKEMTAYSDFPPKSENANYMHNSEMLQYLRDYASHFDLEKYIRFEHKILNIERTKDFETTKQWKVTYENLITKEILHETFDGVMVCTGHHSKEYWPTPFPGQNQFKGRLMHSHSYNCAQGFEDQNVVVVGIGNSGGDIAVELSKVAKKVYLATRSGSWILNRVWDHGEPSDLMFLNRYITTVRKCMPFWLENAIIEHKVNKRFDHGRFGLKPNHRFMQAHVTVNDELPNRIISGTVKVKPNIKQFTEKNGVEFEDGTCLIEVDTVIFATGYSFEFPHIEEGKLIKVEENQVLLYKNMFPIDLSPQNSLALIGLVQPTGSIMPISEMQCRVFCAVLSGNCELPCKGRMLIEALNYILKNKNQFVASRRHTLQIEYTDYMQQLGKLIKVNPNVCKRVFTDPKLANKLIFHGLVPYQYRLDGPHKWPGAREAILTMEKRIFECTRTRVTKETNRSKPHSKPFGIITMFI